MTSTLIAYQWTARGVRSVVDYIENHPDRASKPRCHLASSADDFARHVTAAEHRVFAFPKGIHLTPADRRSVEDRLIARRPSAAAVIVWHEPHTAGVEVLHAHLVVSTPSKGGRP